jgi:serine/threonine protein kinase/Tol biopolymer transport system component
VAGYTVVRELGSGGMGAVYLVRHPRLPRLDALKLLRRELSGDPDFAQRFLQEADVVARLAHRNIVAVLDRGEDDGQLWLTMQYVEGTDAETALAEAGGRLPPERAVHIVGEVGTALDAAHRQQLVHRDVKPANILLRAGDDGEREQVFLTDFGIAKSLDGTKALTRTGMVLATFDYASPEQIESRPLDGRSDLYSLGCVLHRLLTGSVPFPGQSLIAAFHGHMSLPPPRPTALVPGLPAELDDVVARAMAKRPDDRFGSGRELAAAAAAAVAPRRAPTAPVLVRPTEPETVVELPGPPLRPPPARSPTPVYPAPTPPPQPPPFVPAPPEPAPTGRGPGRWIWLALAVAVLVAGGATWWFVGRSSGSHDSGGSSGQSGSPAQAALDALPRGDPLPGGTLVVPRTVGGQSDLHLVDAGNGADGGAITSGAGNDVGPIVSPDRRSVVFARVADGGRELRVVGSDGRSDSPLFGTPPANCDNPGRPAWNPKDPTELALVCHGAGDGGADRLLLAGLDGGTIRNLDAGHPYVDDLAFSADGTHLAYWANDRSGVDGGAIESLPVDGSGSAAQLTTPAGSDADPIWSPDGSTIAFRRDDGNGGRRILVTAADGSGQQPLTSAGFFDQDPAWSPDGQQVAFKSNRGGDGDAIWIVAASGGSPRELPRGDSAGDDAPAWGNR